MSPRSRPRRIYVTDCEGPLSRNDNAQELAAHFIPGGTGFFARLSRYDDLLADVLHRPGYNAGDTLRLLAPFLVAHGATDQALEQYSADNVVLIPGAGRDAARTGTAAAVLHHLHVVHAVHPCIVRSHRLPVRELPLHADQPGRLDARRGPDQRSCAMRPPASPPAR